MNSKKTQNLIFYSDSLHGWLKVSKWDLQVLNIADKISTYSYMNGNNVYLEEDCDAEIYLNALKNVGLNYKIGEKVSRNDQSVIRSYNSYQFMG
tara:strand:+ start:8578 stop:8859 length:282 start_codon:yes stop_codon:yes gene_type:complete